MYPLHAVLRCQHCGSVYHGQTNDGMRVSRHAGPDRDCPPPRTVQSDLLEQQLVEALSQITLPPDWSAQIKRWLRRPQVDSSVDERKGLKRRMERLRYQHLCEAIDDQTFRAQLMVLKVQLNRLPSPPPTVLETYREPAELLQSIGTILGHPVVQIRPDAMAQFQRFCQLGFARIDIKGRQLVAVQPRPRYAELFAVALASKNPAKPEPHGVFVWCG